MQPVWATRLTVEAAGLPAGADLFAEVVETAHGAMWQRAVKFGVLMERDWRGNLDWRSSDNARAVQTRHVRGPSGRAWRGVLVHPSQQAELHNEHLSRRAEVFVREAGSQAVVTIRLMLGSGREVIKPLSFDQRPPALVGALLERFDCVKIGPYPLDAQARAIRLPSVAVLEEELEDPERAHPVIYISMRQDGTYPCDPDLIAEAVAGLARVVTLSTWNVGGLLAGAIGDVPCLNGDIRIFWPDFQRTDTSEMHRLWSGEDYHSPLAADRLPREIAQVVASAAALRIGSDEVVWQLVREDESRRREEAVQRVRADAARDRQELERAYAVLEQSGDGRYASKQPLGEAIARYIADMNDMNELVALGDAEIEQLTRENRELGEERAQLRAQMETLRADIEKLRIDERQAIFTGLDFGLGNPTWRDLVRFVQQHANPSEVLFDRKVEDAMRKAAFKGSAASVWGHFKALITVAHLYHTNQLTKSFADAFQDAGLTRAQYSMSISEHAKQQYGHQYSFLYDRHDGQGPQRVTGEHHLKLSGGNAEYLLRIHFFVDDHNRRFVVYHVGDHLGGKQDTGD